MTSSKLEAEVTSNGRRGRIAVRADSGESEDTEESRGMRFTLRIWRQDGPADAGRLESHEIDDVAGDMSLLEMLDLLNQQATLEGKIPFAFDSDCREGICGMCGLVIDGIAHGKKLLATTCELRMREFDDGDSDHHRALARRGLPGDQRSGRGPQRLRSHHLRGRLCLREHRLRAGRKRRPHRKGRRGPGHGRGGMHRLRGLCGRLPKRVRIAFHGGQGRAVSPPATGRDGARSARSPDGSQMDTQLALEAGFEPYIQFSLMLLLQASTIRATSDDEDMIDYINMLRESILEAYTGIIQGLKEGNRIDLFQPYVQSVLEFLQQIAMDEIGMNTSFPRLWV